MASSNATGNRRKYVTTACVGCRESKIKCDGTTPTCSNCQNRGRECRYRASDDRRKLSARVAIEVLFSRTEQLSQFISENSLEPPPIDDEQAATLKRVLSTLRLNIDIPQSCQSGRDESTSPRTSHVRNDSTTQDPLLECLDDGIIDEINRAKDPVDVAFPGLPSQNWTWNDLRGDIFDTQAAPEDPNLQPYNHSVSGSIPSPHTGASPLAIKTPQPETSSTADSATDVVDALVEQLSDRMGSLQIGPGGNVRYFGPTSDFHLVQMPPSDNLTIHRSVRNDGQEYLERLGLHKDVDDSLRKHLTDLYFTWQNPTMCVVDRKMYEEAMVQWQEQKQDTPYFSEALENAILALGAAFEARYYPGFLTFPKSLSDFFADRAKALLEIELDSPSLATVQAMTVLSGHDFGCKRDARGWLYSGMAVRLSFDLALHVDMSPYVSAGKLSQKEADLRRLVFWGVYTTDQMWGFHLGRPSRINMQDVTVTKPTDRQASIASLETDLDTLSKHRALLWQLMAPIGYGLYGSLKSSTDTLRQLTHTASAELTNWQLNLPPSLQVDPDNRTERYLPYVLLLHMQYYQHIIYTHRPLMSKSFRQSTDTLDTRGLSFEYARKRCIDAAISIAKLLNIYEIHYTLRRINVQAVNCTGSAALLLIFANFTNFGDFSREETGLHLSTCLRALDEYVPAWESAKRVRDFLTILQRQWDVQVRAARGRPPGSSVSSGHDYSSPRKRARSQGGPLSQQDTRHGLGEDPQSSDAINIINNEVDLDLDWVFTGETTGFAGFNM
ncbi:hypothetical protein PFICI_10607 [Pestalotiopsis fici W106-1]|uniref:Zn(2)-C6 fungal-type domain-containing protein n=1 Tax=Pestalotiopsis fici (strain W106-1 / CGMCC3.15140) TaxID=1229662 RepID=W3WXH2_PESFW|nr:uncharacterized protein PFICI_10607 [Pestalotiopsis fici W106-1]ETS78545.1 hypothetical protein PFICI_10607 [Pestalotiopsis fici W106-1]